MSGGERAVRVSLQLAPFPSSSPSLFPRLPRTALDHEALGEADAIGAVVAEEVLALKLQHIRLYSPESLQQSLTGRMAAETLQNELWQTDGNPAYDLAKRLIDVGVVLALPVSWWVAKQIS